MSKLQTVLCFGLSVMIFPNCVSAKQHWSNQAEKWVKTYLVAPDGILVIDQSDLQVLLNLLYLSYARAWTTLSAQELTVSALEAVWQATQNIMQTRRNPSKDIAYSIDQKSFESTTAQLAFWHGEHLRIGKAYCAVLELVLNGSIIADGHVVEGIHAIRSQARRAIVQALADVRTHVQTILSMKSPTPDAQIKKVIDHIDDYIQDSTRNFNIADFVWGLMPTFILKSFVQSDVMTVMLNETWWNAHIQLLRLSNSIWRALETARAQLYLDYYKAAYNCAKKYSADSRVCTYMFDEQGLLALKKRTQQLPDPTLLTVTTN